MNDARIHTVFGILFVVSFFLSDQAVKLLPTWYDPKVGLLSFVIAGLWITVFFLSRARAFVDELKVVRDRLERLENKLTAIEDELPRG